MMDTTNLSGMTAWKSNLPAGLVKGLHAGSHVRASPSGYITALNFLALSHSTPSDNHGNQLDDGEYAV